MILYFPHCSLSLAISVLYIKIICFLYFFFHDLSLVCLFLLYSLFECGSAASPRRFPRNGSWKTIRLFRWIRGDVLRTFILLGLNRANGASINIVLHCISFWFRSLRRRHTPDKIYSHRNVRIELTRASFRIKQSAHAVARDGGMTNIVIILNKYVYMLLPGRSSWLFVRLL